MWSTLVVLGGIVGSGVLLFLAIRRMLDRLSGWTELAARYGARQAPAAWQWRHQTIRVGSVRYRRSMRIAAQPEGLYLDEAGILNHPVLCIPWSELRKAAPARFYGRPSMRVEAGPGRIELPVELYDAVLRLAGGVK